MSTITRTLFITQEQLTQNTVLNENIDWKLLKQLVWDVQQMKVQPIIGSILYKKIAANIAASTLIDPYLTLLNDYIIDTITAFIVSESPDYLNYKFTNKAIVQKSSDNSTPMTEDQMIGIMDRWRNKAQWYAERLSRYLCANPLLFPEFTQSGDITTIYPNINNYTNGMYLEGDGCSFADRLNLPRYGRPDQWRRGS